MKNIVVDDKFYKTVKKYAVFIPLIEVDGRDHILFEIRSSYIAQPGDVSFPGGSLEENEDFKMAAIRETREELNLHEKDIDYMGYSSMVFSMHNRIVKAYYGRINKPLEEIEYNIEVERLFTVDFEYLLNNPPKEYTIDYKMDFPKDFPFEKIPNGKDYGFYPLLHKIYFFDTEPSVWGLTGRLLNDFVNSYKKGEISF